jgi:drug/metabolite transporter (DMT)-like permease
MGMLLGFAGAVVILAPWNTSQVSFGHALACLAASASYGASYVYMARYLIGKGLSPLVLSASQLIAASGLLLLATPFGGLDSPHWRLDAVLGLVALGAVGTGIAYVLNYRIISDDGPVLASTVTYLIPLVAVAFGALFLQEDITPTLVLGVVVVLSGVALTRDPKRAPL